MSESSGTDRERILANIADVRRGIASACADAGRSAEDVRLIAVTKTFPAEYVTIAADAGLSDVAESKAQEGAAKAAELVDSPLVWHFVGRLQRNKANAVAQFADVVQSVDRPRLVQALDRGAAQSERFDDDHRLRILLQVDLDPSHRAEDTDSTADRGGVHPDLLMALADEVAATELLRLDGLMAIAPLGADPEACFARLAQLSEEVKKSHPAAEVISAGMSGDYRVAIANGATWVRVGTALFGRRPLTSDTGDS